MANRKVGDIRRRLGEFDRSRSAYEKTIQRIERLDASVRNSQTVRLEYARTQNGLGISLQELRLFDMVRDTHRSAIDQLDSTSDAPIERFELARSLYLLHVAQPRNKRNGRSGDDRRPNANSHLKRAVGILDELRTTHPNVPDYRFLLARCFLASGCNSDGTLSEFQTQAIDILDELVETTPDVADYRYELGDAYRDIEWREYFRKRDVIRPPEELANSESRLRKALAARGSHNPRQVPLALPPSRVRQVIFAAQTPVLGPHSSPFCSDRRGRRRRPADRSISVVGNRIREQRASRHRPGTH